MSGRLSAKRLTSEPSEPYSSTAEVSRNCSRSVALHNENAASVDGRAAAERFDEIGQARDAIDLTQGFVEVREQLRGMAARLDRVLRFDEPPLRAVDEMDERRIEQQRGQQQREKQRGHPRGLRAVAIPGHGKAREIRDRGGERRHQHERKMGQWRVTPNGGAGDEQRRQDPADRHEQALPPRQAIDAPAAIATRKTRIASHSATACSTTSATSSARRAELQGESVRRSRLTVAFSTVSPTIASTPAWISQTTAPASTCMARQRMRAPRLSLGSLRRPRRLPA